jgi:hypothetical protein
MLADKTHVTFSPKHQCQTYEQHISLFYQHPLAYSTRRVIEAPQVAQMQGIVTSQLCMYVGPTAGQRRRGFTPQDTRHDFTP